ncbi:hypothetical protein LWX53_08920 [bacterium]|nr:hypothetical protein [bacterium]
MVVGEPIGRASRTAAIAGAGFWGGISLISCERWKDGIVMTVEGMRVLRHAALAPSIFVETAKPASGKSRPRWRSAGSCEIVNEGRDLTVMRFRGLFSVRICYEERILRFAFSPEGDFAGRLRLRLGATRGEMILGAGPRDAYDMKGMKLSFPAGVGGEGPAGEPVFFSTKGPWLWLRGSGTATWQFGQRITEITCDSLPENLAIGFGKEPASRMALLTGHRAEIARPGRGRARLPAELQAAPVVDAASAGKELAEAAFLRTADGLEPSSIVDVAAWERALSEAAAREVPPGRATQGGAAGIAAALLSLSLAGEGNAFVPAVAGQGSETSPEAAASALDMAVFGPLFLIKGDFAGAGESGLRALAVAARLYDGLRPYRERSSELWVERGIPVLSHPALAYPEEEKLWERSDQYLFGPDLLVAPGATERDGTRRLELPEDEWIHLWTSRHYPAGTTVVHAPAGRPAVFYRARSEFAPLFDALRQKAARL